VEVFRIARNSTFVFKKKAVSIKQVAEDIGVKYVLEGSIQKSGEQIPITAQMTGIPIKLIHFDK